MGAEHKRTPTESLSSLQIREIALAAMVDERTLVRATLGKRLLPMTRERIRRVLEARGLLHLLKKETEGAR